MVLIYLLTTANIAAGFWLNIGLVCYEHSLPTARRTLINRLLAQNSWHALLIVAPVHSIIFLVETFGKLSDIFCHILIAYLIGLSMSMFFFGNATMILR